MSFCQLEKKKRIGDFSFEHFYLCLPSRVYSVTRKSKLFQKEFEKNPFFEDYDVFNILALVYNNNYIDICTVPVVGTISLILRAVRMNYIHSLETHTCHMCYLYQLMYIYCHIDLLGHKFKLHGNVCKQIYKKLIDNNCWCVSGNLKVCSFLVAL